MTDRKEQHMYRQGDILIIPTDGIPDGERRRVEPDARGRLILALGEATGHAHGVVRRRSADEYEDHRTDLGRVTQATAVLEEVEGLDDRILTVLGEATVVHEEHDPIDLDEGTYLVRRQREYAPSQIRRVAD